jgi:hypothetical protein
MKTTAAIAALGLCFALGIHSASAASATLEKFGGLSLLLPDSQWPRVRMEESPTDAATPWTRAVFDDPEGHSSVVLFATVNDGRKFANIEDWISKQELRSFLTWSVGKYDSGDFQATQSAVGSLGLDAGVDAKLVKEDLTVSGDRRQAWMIYFSDRENRYWYWIGFYSHSALADHGPALENVKAGLSWRQPAGQ